jgi:hypothetical protein
MALAVIRSKWGYRQRLSSKQLNRGATETFGSWFWPTNKKINLIITECIKLSQAGHRMKAK